MKMEIPDNHFAQDPSDLKYGPGNLPDEPIEPERDMKAEFLEEERKIKEASDARIAELEKKLHEASN
jgi:hypothetical protein